MTSPGAHQWDALQGIAQGSKASEEFAMRRCATVEFTVISKAPSPQHERVVGIAGTVGTGPAPHDEN